MKYFWILFASGSSDSLIADVVDFKGVSVDRLCVGQAIEAWDSQAYVAVGESGQSGSPDDVLQTAASVPIVSPRLRTVLDEAQISGIQYLPVTVKDGSRILGPFFVVNVLARINALNEQLSDLRRFSNDYFIENRRGLISGIRRPVLRVTPDLVGVHIFRLAEYWPPVFVTQRFRDLFRLGRFTGIDFEEVAVTDGSQAIES